jgi:subtilisin family serine protease
VKNEVKERQMRKWTAVLALLLVLAMVLPVSAGEPMAPKRGRHVYLVRMAAEPVIAYEGDVEGIQATKPGKGGKINPNSAHVKKYTQHLEKKHNKVLKGVGASPDVKVYDYFYAINGFAAVLTKQQAADMTKQPGVMSVQRDRLRQLATDNTPNFLGLTDPAGPWAKGYDGSGVVVGIIDSGIWPEHPSFADDGKYRKPPVDLDACDFGNTAWNPDDLPFTCNNKLIGARSSLEIYKIVNGWAPYEYDSARDNDGHGTHTASTAAGNAGVEASMFGIPRGTVSGMAPRAHVVAYKACGEVGCYTGDTSAAIDQAVLDGVDVINYSIGGGASLLGFDDVAFLFADAAGVFCATSAGNSGPDYGSMGGPASVPWITGVGASTHSRAFISEITVSGPGDPPMGLWGGSVTPGITDFNLVDAEGIADAEGDTSGTCVNAFPAGTFQADDAVLCNQYDFGVARVQRVEYVKDAGGGAVIFHNSADVSVMPTDNHVLPTVHMLNDVGQPLKDYLVANPGAVTVSFTAGEAKYSPDDPRVKPNAMASFSSRGVNTAAEDIIKPDVTAPGVSILAGNTPILYSGQPGHGAQGQYFQAIMGTSMSSPHVAGLFALLKEAHPGWSPAMARSALMTTAYSDGVMKEDGVTAADPFDIGAGHVNPGGKANKGSAFEPGLAYDAGLFEYAGFICGVTDEFWVPGTCEFLESLGIPFDASDLNLPSIGIAELAGTQTVMRTVTSVTNESGWREYTVSVDAPPGYDVTVTPPTIQLKGGQSATYYVTLTNVSAPVGEWRFGSLTWNDDTGHYDVYSPIAVRGSLYNAPSEVFGSGEDGSASFDILFGYTGPYAAAAHGLEPAVLTVDNVLQDDDQIFDPGDVATGGANLHQFALSGAANFRIAMPPDATEPEADLDIFVYDPTGEQVATSTRAGTDELIDIELPMDGTWDVYVHGWSCPGGDSDYVMYTWAISATPGGSLSIVSAPTSATLGATETIDVSWAGATAGDWYLGAVSHSGPSSLMGLTLVNVDNR